MGSGPRAEPTQAGGRAPHRPYRVMEMHTQASSKELLELSIAGNFVEVFLACEGHDGCVGINDLEKIQLPILPSLYGAMLAGVDVVLMGAGIPTRIPGVLDAFAKHEPASYPLAVTGASDDDDTRLASTPATSAVRTRRRSSGRSSSRSCRRPRSRSRWPGRRTAAWTASWWRARRRAVTTRRRGESPSSRTRASRSTASGTSSTWRRCGRSGCLSGSRADGGRPRACATRSRAGPRESRWERRSRSARSRTSRAR
jgi:hypothetical protein